MIDCNTILNITIINLIIDLLSRLKILKQLIYLHNQYDISFNLFKTGDLAPIVKTPSIKHSSQSALIKLD